MTLRVSSEISMDELLKEIYDAPDFSFLYEWPNDRSFFPRLNGASVTELAIKGEAREALQNAISDVEQLQPLLAETDLESKAGGGSFSDAISVFHRDGEVSVVAVPVTESTLKSLGGFLLSRELAGMVNAERFFDELKALSVLSEGAQRALEKKVWWRRKTAEVAVDLRRAVQLLQTARAQGPAQLSKLVQMLQARIAMTTGASLPQVSDWQQALLKLETLKELPADSFVYSIEIEEAEGLKNALDSINAGFERLDRRRSILSLALRNLQRENARSFAENYSLDDFARRVRGKGFPKKLLENRVIDFRVSQGDCLIRPVSIGDVISLAKESKSHFNTSSLKAGLKLLETYFQDQMTMLRYPKLSDSGEVFDRFLAAAHELHLEQQRPYPVRAQFDVLYKLLKDSPQQLHLVARDSDAIKKLIGSLKMYTDSARLARLCEALERSSAAQARDFFSTNPANFQAVLSHLGFNVLSLDQISGFLAPELTSKIKNIDLELAGMKAQLRSYQIFGAQYALYQERIILGDEMGLGKTVTALALAKHLTNEGAQRILVVTPLAVLENWRREVLKHTDYSPRVLYGDSLESDLSSWIEDGGVALATFESLQRVNKQHVLEGLKSIELTIVDEAHFIKNPLTKRAQGVLPWVRGARRVMLMTGTPLENNLSEFVQLITYVQPNLELPTDELAHSKFRKAISPVYLRRNQEDVLQELPEKQEEEDYIELSDADKEYYRRALAQGDWHMARRARVLAGDKSSTVQRIQSIVAESVANGHKVLVFSYYLETLAVLRRLLKEDDPYLPLTGALNSIERQVEVDKFTNSKEPGVLLAQATAGGTGLNIQAASVVIIVEPQLKPSLEDQMIGRALRMGQTKAVRVIRLRGKGTVDEHWVTMLNEKRKVFEATAGVSDAAALDSIIDASNTSKEIMDAEREAWGV